MIRKFMLLLVCLTTILFEHDTFSQDSNANKRFQVAVFTPLFLDSAFDASIDYTYGTNFPKFINPGLEFYEGIELAADSLNKLGARVDVRVYDTRSERSSVARIIASKEFEAFDLVLGHVNGTEARSLATAASKNTVPFINVNYPNDAGVQNNPYYVILNSTLTTQLRSLYKLLQRNFALADIIYIRTKSTSDERLLANFKEIEKNTTGVPIKFKYLTLEGDYIGSQLEKHLDSNKNNVFVVGNLDVNFGNKLIQNISDYGESYNTTLIGMPTWDNIMLAKNAHENLEVVYGTPFYINPEDSLVARIHDNFKEKFYSRPSDMVYRGFETLLHFTRLLQQHGSNIASSIGEKKYRVFTDFDIQPVLDKKTMTHNYFENQKIYFIRRSGKEIKGVY